MNRSHVQDEELELYALGSLDAGECGPLRAHLEVCPECRQRLAAARGRVHLVALAAGWREPPQDAREKLLRRVRSEAAPDFSHA